MKKWEKSLGKTFNSLTLIGVTKVGNKYPGIYRCECGNECFKDMSQVRSGKYKSCGCLGNEYRSRAHTKHGQSKGKGTSESPEYVSWRAMRERCTNTNSSSYANYGGRGITVCERWMDSFSNFFEDMGAKPTPKHTLDRVDNEKGYNPNNCVWATRTQQVNNRRDKRNSTGYKGVVKSSNSSFSAQLCVNYKKFYLGSYPTAREAHLVYLKAKKLHTV